MPHIANTPESLLARADSRNPATTCKGITANGRPCRRVLASTQGSSPSVTQKKGTNYQATNLESLYCWQHKDQAITSAPCVSSIPEGNPRTSIDTLMDRLGVLEINDGSAPQKKQRKQTQLPGKTGLSEKRRPRKKSTFCCFTIDEDSDGGTPSKPIQKPMQQRPTGPSPYQTPYKGAQKPKPTSAQRPQNGRVPAPSNQGPTRPQAQKQRHSSTSSQTQSLLSWIPPTLPPQTTSTLLTELAKPISEADDEGYIYMFWVTPQKTTSTRGEPPTLPSRELAASLIPPAQPNNSTHLRPPAQSRSVSDALRTAKDLNALSSNPTSISPGTIRLKIGRTSNVHRRLNEWSKQCSHDLTLIRYYPYTSSSSSSSSPARKKEKGAAEMLAPGRKVPHVHRVERLIHLELAALRVRDLGKCADCGKEHREWFEVEASKEALKSIDDCVRRWVSWGESI
ncbi:hypothetical protein N7460_009038 [Penicillium canescens]|uniref:Bacteriophage T5 Orf172 DNA-binding domain-containing protein n=1 Tax=Penicillium canescens TaxID=5083 RepID=A0AAD6I7I8_PENCN|nr:hypothetical protein N7460_009038 [Penicillium canescens]KAJ6046527.1 hypothetical protein N7444_007781 [Penicillium canescens]